MSKRGTRGRRISLLLLLAASVAGGCSRRGGDSSAAAPPAPQAPVRIDRLTILAPDGRPYPGDTVVRFRLDAQPPLPENAASSWIFVSPERRLSAAGHGSTLDMTFPAGGIYIAQATVGAVTSPPIEVPVLRLAIVDGDGRPVREARIAALSAASFDEKGRLRESAVASSPDRIRIVAEDPALGAPPSVSVAGQSIPLAGSGAHRSTRMLLLVADPDDAAASDGAALLAAPGGRLEVRYGGSTFGVKIGPAVLHEIPFRVVAVGPGLPPAAEIERAIDQRLARANAVWEPHGRRFTRGPVVRLDAPRGLALIRGRAAGADAQGRPSKAGLKVDGRELSVPAAWRNDGAPMTPKATARALIEKAGASLQVRIFDGLIAGDREAVVLRVWRPDGIPAILTPLAEGNDVAQALTPLPSEGLDEIEVAPSAGLLSLEEIAVLASGKGGLPGGFDLFIVGGLRSLQSRRAFKVYPEGVFEEPLAGSAIAAWPILDGTGRYPYALARLAGELILPPGLRPAEEDTLFADPMPEAPGPVARKRVGAATAAAIAERGRGLSSRK